MHRQDGRQEIDRRTLLAKGAHLRRFSSQAAPGKNLGDSPPRVLDSFALQTSQATIFVRSSGSGPPVLLLQSSARAGRAEVLLNLCERNHHHHWIDRTLVKSGTCIEALRVI